MRSSWCSPGYCHNQEEVAYGCRARPTAAVASDLDSRAAGADIYHYLVFISNGPYRFVRHPGYVGGLLYGIATPLILGSYWARVPTVVAALLLVDRTALEDRTLQRELPGYVAYTEAVRYQLLPRVW